MKKIVNICLCILLISCSSLDIDDIPLTEGEIPFKLPPGVYEDVDGKKHNTNDERWSVSEAELFQDIVEDDDDLLWRILASLGLLVGVGGAGVALRKS